ncbi:MAG: hypothetical protein EOM69_13430 [Clostridia bacterium]|nr:hypothetical protein [Clostridia bacterium]
MTPETDSLSSCIEEYTNAVARLRLPRAYRGILSALGQFQTSWKSAHASDAIGALYQGYMDMSFVAFAPAELAEKRLKISLVFLHPTGEFSLWLAAGNREIQKRVSAALKSVPLGQYSLSVLEPGVDAIIAYDLPKPYAFDEPETLNRVLIASAERFTRDMISLTKNI